MTIVPPEEILDFWIGDARTSAEATNEKRELWFKKSDETDTLLRDRFRETVDALAGGLAEEWDAVGPHANLAAVIALDQFSRNIFRGTAQSFASDALALKLTLNALDRGDHLARSPAEQAFTYLPLEHAEDHAMQARCVVLFSELAKSAPIEFKDACEDWLDFAHKHKVVIDQFGRFPHRNDILGRRSTQEELEYLAEPGAGF